MDENRFWGLVGAIDREALQVGDEEGAVAPLREALEALPPKDLEGFEEQLARALYAIDGRAFADAAGESGDSDDAFLYARCFVVARGREHYESVKADPTKMPQSLDEWGESLFYLASQIYETSTGNSWEYSASVSYETGSNTAQW